MKPQRKYRLGMVSNNYWGVNRFYGAPTFTIIFHRGIDLNKKNKPYIIHLTTIYTYFQFFKKSQTITGSKEGSYKGVLIAGTAHPKKERMKPQRKHRLGTVSNNYWGRMGAGLNRFYGAPTFTLIFRRSLHNVIGFSALIEVS